MDDDDSDTHICLRCQTTIVGLDNYINHARKQCARLANSAASVTRSAAPSPFATLVGAPLQLSTQNDNEKAPIRPDDFFFLLELQSSNANNKPCQTLCQPSSSRLRTPSPALQPEDWTDEDSSNDNHGPNPPKRHTGGKWKPGERPTETHQRRCSNSDDSAEEPNELTCRPCGESFDTAHQMALHLVTRGHWRNARGHPDWDRLLLTHGDTLARLAPYRCLQCPFYFHSLDKLKSHFCYWPPHLVATPNLKYTCSVCGCTLDSATKVSEHLQCHGAAEEVVIGFLDGGDPPQDETNYPCPICGARFARKSTMWAHRRNSHTNFGKFTCKQCDFKCGTATKLKLHEETHAKDRVKRFLCGTCGRGFFRKYQLNQHQKQHVDDTKIHRCTFEGCDAGFRVPSELVYHLRTHNDERLFLCDTCGDRFRSGRDLTKHRQNIHSVSKPYPCPHCPYSATQKGQLRRHLRVHTGAKPYRCPHCKFQCSAQDNLRKHIANVKSHEGLKMYPCKRCPFATNSASALVHHSKTMHNIGRSVKASTLTGIYSKDEDQGCETIVHP